MFWTCKSNISTSSKDIYLHYTTLNLLNKKNPDTPEYESSCSVL